MKTPAISKAPGRTNPDRVRATARPRRASFGRLTAATLAVALLCQQVNAASALPGDTIVVVVKTSYSDPSDPSEGENVVITSSGGYSATLPLTNGSQIVQFLASVEGETVTAAIDGFDGDETIDYTVRVIPLVTPPPFPPLPAPSPPVPSPPAPPVAPANPNSPDVDSGGNGGRPGCSDGSGNPIRTLTGNKFQDATDFVGGGAWPLVFKRYYNSNPWDTKVKAGWHHNFEFTADLHLTGVAATSTIVVNMPDGRAVTYKASGMQGADYLWASTTDPTGRLVSKAGVYSYISPDNIVYSFIDRNTPAVNGVVSGSTPVVAIQEMTGYQQTLSYLDTGTVTLPDASVYLRAVDSFGRVIQISDNSTSASVGDRRPHSVELPDSDDYDYKLLFENFQTPVGWFPYRRSYDTYAYPTTYLYGESSLAPSGLTYALTGIVDANGDRFASYGYDATGRAVMTTHAGNAEKTDLVFNSNGSTTVTTANGSVTYAKAVVNGLAKTAGVSQPAGAGCSAANSSSTFDANGNLASREDFNQHRSCYKSDARNLQISKVEGLANTASCSAVIPDAATLPAGSRKISMQWHPAWRVPNRVAEPGRITTIVYNGQSDPATGQLASCVTPTYGQNGTVTLATGTLPIAVACRSTQQATTDTDGSKGFAATADAAVPLRTTSYTYTELGQVLTARDSLGRTTTYSYYTEPAPGHAKGDLKTLTDPLSHVTTYTNYDSAGRLIESVDPNGLKTQYMYQAPGRLYAIRKAANFGRPDALVQVTLFAYDAEGQLTRVTAPDGSYLGYQYDTAHRQIAVFDNLGNRIEYTLDDASNRKAESVKDPSGALARTLSRSFDALGRVQQTTGRP